MNNKLNSKLEEIDILLNNEDKLDEYIAEIENTKISYSIKLEERILYKITEDKNKVKNKTSYFTILKMVACMVLALILCQTDFIKNTDHISNNVEVVERKKEEEKLSFIDSKMNDISNFFMKPIIIEKGEK